MPPTEEKTAVAAGELVGLVETHLPQRFYRTESGWRMLGAAMIVRMADTVRSVITLRSLGLDGDAMTLLRALYEQVVVYCWIASEPEGHLRGWISDAEYQQLKLHNDSLAFGQKVLNKRDLARAKKAQKLPDIAQLAEAADKYWSARIAAFRPPKGKPAKPIDILNLRGLYVAVYRITSRNAHTKPHAIDPYCDFDSYPRVVHLAKHEPTSYPSLVVPLYAQALLVCHHELKWPDPEQVTAINNEMYSFPSS